jgi:4-hydroxy-4-methyl-2-oxoglutarate aldolase
MTKKRTVDTTLMARVHTTSAATLHEANKRGGALPAAIKPLATHMRVCGPAYTVKSPPGDNLWLHHAIYAAAPGDVLVIEVGGALDFGYWGEVMTVAAQERRISGLVIHGGVRDTVRLLELDFPVFSTTPSIRGPDKSADSGGTLGAAVTIGDVKIEPGDLVVGDADGVVVLPRAWAARIVADGELRDVHEQAVLRRLHAGETTMQIYGLPAPHALEKRS